MEIVRTKSSPLHISIGVEKVFIFIFLSVGLALTGCGSFTMEERQEGKIKGKELEVKKTIIRSEEGRHFGRTSIVRKDSTTLILMYKESKSHAGNKRGRIHVQFSGNNGDSWSQPNHTLNGERVEGFPATPPGAEVGSSFGPGEPWLYRSPEGDFILHSWSVDYTRPNEEGKGTWQMRSDDGTKWTKFRKIDFGGIQNDNSTFSTDDHFVVNDTIYAGARQHKNGRVRSILLVSEEGLEWEKRSSISDFKHNTSEVGIEYVGGGRIVAILNNKERLGTFYTASNDMGGSWEELRRIEKDTDIWDRPRIFTTAHIKGSNEWWKSSTLIGVGNLAIETGSSFPRQNSLWISRDNGDTWSGVYAFDYISQDGGYGDVYYDGDNFHFITYRGDRKEANLVGYKFRLPN